MTSVSEAQQLGPADRRPPLERLLRCEDLERTLAPFLTGSFGALDGIALFDAHDLPHCVLGPGPMRSWEQLAPEAPAALRRGGSGDFGVDDHQFAVRPCFAGAERVGSFVVSIPASAGDCERLPAIADALIGVLASLLQAGFAAWVSSEMHLAASESNYRALQSRNSELERAVAHLREVDELKSNFLATVSHELRTPLTSIIGFSEMLARGVAGPLNAEQVEYATTILERGEDLLRLITEILEMSKLELGTVRLSLRPVTLAEIVGRAFSSVAIQAERAEVHLLSELDAALPPALADGDKIQQVLINLVSNAVKFNRRGGRVTVRAEVAPMRRPFDEDFFGEELADALRVSVADTGVGIPEDQLFRIFDAFYQVDAGTTREHGGTGLGLSIVRQLVEAHGGEVWAESVVGAGTTFCFTLPLAEGRASES